MAEDNRTIQSQAAESGVHEAVSSDDTKKTIGVYDRPERKISPLAIVLVLLLVLALLVVFLVFTNVL